MKKKTIKSIAKANDAGVKTSNDTQKKLVMHTGSKIRIKMMKGNQNG